MEVDVTTTLGIDLAVEDVSRKMEVDPLYLRDNRNTIQEIVVLSKILPQIQQIHCTLWDGTPSVAYGVL